ncbi:hypothetical protein PVT68_02765 [Microbulbifer bruguierae]|uniref:DUF4365 domain-containing protein n=1 Tax=Microbulbifer bruguierae TaxID=3029061 RepID=A0ABY8NEW7_9GAMM|nr:hypothetical protein [Microbulbifer bruguierae]WGL17230.1 hypothetical protein PVT68_02765 [Microbulbifer bruguierae]
MKPQFSEFTYGYTLVEELSRDYGFSAVPVFPSLLEEGRTGGGYDAKLGIKGLPFFLQFKRSDFLGRSNSKYHAAFGGPYYRFHLHARRHSVQHDLLLQLESYGNPVFYVAPKFHKNSELHDSYFGSSISKNSIWVAPTEIGKLPDDNEHSVCFDRLASKTYFCSEPRPIEIRMNFEKGNVEEYVSWFRQRDGFIRFHKESWQDLYSKMEYVFRTRDRVGFAKLSRYLDEEESIVIKAGRLSRLAFGADMVNNWVTH